MASLLSGSRELVYIKTDKVSVTIKGKPSHPYFQNSECNKVCSELKILSQDPFSLCIRENEEVFHDDAGCCDLSGFGGSDACGSDGPR